MCLGGYLFTQPESCIYNRPRRAARAWSEGRALGLIPFPQGPIWARGKGSWLAITGAAWFGQAQPLPPPRPARTAAPRHPRQYALRLTAIMRARFH